MNKREKIILGVALTIGLLVGGLFGMIYQQERLISGVVDFGESITGNSIIIDVNESVLADEMLRVAKELQEDNNIQ